MKHNQTKMTAPYPLRKTTVSYPLLKNEESVYTSFLIHDLSPDL